MQSQTHCSYGSTGLRLKLEFLQLCTDKATNTGGDWSRLRMQTWSSLSVRWWNGPRVGFTLIKLKELRFWSRVSKRRSLRMMFKQQ